MATRRVFVIWTYPLFLEAVRRLLAGHDIEWVGDSSDHAAAREQLARLGPDTVLVEEGKDVLTEIVQILEADTKAIKVIRLSLATNALSVYHREERTIAQADDLFHLVRDE